MPLIFAALKDGGFSTDCLIIDGYDFERGSPADFLVLRQLAADLELEIWFSASLREKDVSFDAQGFPALLTPYLEHIAVFIYLKSEEGVIRLELKKDHEHIPQADLHLKLDPKILLIMDDK